MCGVIGRDTVLYLWSRDDDQRDTVPVLISMVCFIFAVIMQVNIPICDMFKCYDVGVVLYPNDFQCLHKFTS